MDVFFYKYDAIINEENFRAYTQMDGTYIVHKSANFNTIINIK